LDVVFCECLRPAGAEKRVELRDEGLGAGEGALLSEEVADESNERTVGGDGRGMSMDRAEGEEENGATIVWRSLL